MPKKPLPIRTRQRGAYQRRGTQTIEAPPFEFHLADSVWSACQKFLESQTPARRTGDRGPLTRWKRKWQHQPEAAKGLGELLREADLREAIAAGKVKDPNSAEGWQDWILDGVVVGRLALE